MTSGAGTSGKWRRHGLALAVFLGGLALTAGVSWELHREALEIDQKRFALRMEEVIDQLDGRVEKTEQLLQQLQDLLSYTRADKPQLLQEWAARRGLFYNLPWVCGLLVATNVQPRAWHGAFPTPDGRWSKHWREFEAFADALTLECRVAWKSSTRRQLLFLDDYDLKGNRQSTNGYNGFSKAAWSAGLRIGRQQPVMRDRDGNPVTGIVFFMPVRSPDVADVLQHVFHTQDVRKRAVRWAHLDAMILAPVDFVVLERALWEEKESDLGVEIFSTLQPTEQTWLNSAARRPRALDPEFRSRAYLTATAKWPMYSDRFSIFFHTTPLFEAQSSRRVARTASASGLGLTLLATALMAVISQSRARQERLTATILEARDALAATQRERERLGHDLHDGAIQSLYAVQLGLTRTAETIAAELPGASQVLGETRRRIDEVIAELRRFILTGDDARETGAALGLDQVLASIVRWMEPTTSARLTFESAPGVAAGVTPAQSVALMQIARTALGNAVRHARATRITVQLLGKADSLQLVVLDDGVGFDAARPESGGLGLRTMRSRAAEMGGTLAIETRPGGGTRVTVSVPRTEAGMMR